MAHGRIVRSSFKSAWWLPDPHTQTIWPYLCRSSKRADYIQERLELPDGDFVDLCWTLNSSGPIVAVFHGLEGNIHSPYAAAIMSTIKQLGWRGVFMHFRGCSGEANRLPRSYHSGETGDIRFLINSLAERYPHVPLAATGYSLGGNALLKYLGEEGKQTPLRAAVAVSVPYLLDVSAARLEQGLSRLYQWRLLRLLQNRILDRFSTVNAPFDPDKIRSCNTFRKFDDKVTAPLNGFNGVDDYYTRSSSRQYLRAIEIPVLLIHAVNDPFMTPAVIPEETELGENVILELSSDGGHAGFTGGTFPWKPEYWLDKRIPEYLSKYF